MARYEAQCRLAANGVNARWPMAGTDVNDSLGTSESAVRLRREEELAHAMKTEGGVPTIHAFGHSFTRSRIRSRESSPSTATQTGARLAGAGLELET
jgi:hypothetical protein